MRLIEIRKYKRIPTIVFRLFMPKYGDFAKTVALNKLKKLLKSKVKNKYLFILSPPYCGSTLLNEIISTSPAVSVNNSVGTREGQFLPTVKEIMLENRWDEKVDFDWEAIKHEWRKYWDTSKLILLEKSPPNIMRAEAISKVFTNSNFIIFYRNPYCQCESLIRRNKKSPKASAEFSIRCLKYQKKNILALRNSMVISYEDLTEDPRSFESKVKKLIPELKSINTNSRFSAHNFKGRPLKIENLNNEKIRKLNKDQLEKINEVFIKNKEVLDFFGYRLTNITHAKNKI